MISLSVCFVRKQKDRSRLQPSSGEFFAWSELDKQDSKGTITGFRLESRYFKCISSAKIPRAVSCVIRSFLFFKRTNFFDEFPTMRGYIRVRMVLSNLGESQFIYLFEKIIFHISVDVEIVLMIFRLLLWEILWSEMKEVAINVSSGNLQFLGKLLRV